MPKATTKDKSKTTATAKEAQITVSLNSYLNNEIIRLSELHGLNVGVLEEFTQFVIANHKKKDLVIKPVKVKSLTLAQIKVAVYQYFSVKNTTELRKSGGFKMATDGMDELNLSVKDGWEKLYRKFVGILPEEDNQTGYGCINGINIFNYFKPWRIFGLDPQTATSQDIKDSYYRLSKIYHPDVQGTGDSKVFEAINIIYKSISAKA
jgi:DnaJ domain